MEPIVIITGIPIILAIMSFFLPINWLKKTVAYALILHFILNLWLTLPVLQGTAKIISITPELAIDKLSASFLLLTLFVGCCSLTHAQFFFSQEEKGSKPPSTQSIRLIYFCSCIFLLAMSIVFLCNNLGYLWIAVEASTLSSAPLVYFRRTKNALEATWKYLIICSVGIAFALFGTVLIFASGQHSGHVAGTLNILELMSNAKSLQISFLRLGFIFCLLGYGTKAGMFPIHSWLPDAYSEAPAPMSAMLSGSLINCALFAIWKISQIVIAAQSTLLPQDLLVGAGTITVVAASFFLVRQHGFKRLWAYSSIENVGLMLIAIGLGSGFLFFLQALNHSLSKVSLFLLSGNIIQAANTKHLHELRGILSVSRSWGVLIALSAFAVTGAPPFGTFISEWLILTKAFEQHEYAVVLCLILALALAFIAICIHLGQVLLGKPKSGVVAFRPFATSIVPLLLVTCSLILGFITNFKQTGMTP